MSEIGFILEALEAIFNPNETESSETVNEGAGICVPKIPFVEFHQYLLIPSVILSVVMAFTIRRKYLLPSVMDGRPGFVFPMDILGKSNRFSYAAAWGMLAYLAADIIFNQQYALDLQGHNYVTVFRALISMLIYGMDYFPLFASLALESAVGYVIGTLYAWMLTGVFIVQGFQCPMETIDRIYLILGQLPKLVCLLYLCISLPVRLIQALRQKTTSILSAREMVEFLSMRKDLGKTVEAIHVYKLLRPPSPPPSPPTSIGQKVLGIVRGLIHDWIYHRHTHFRYSARVLSVMLIGIILVYKTTFELTWLALAIINGIEKFLFSMLDLWGWEAIENEIKLAGYVRWALFTLHYLLVAFRGCFIASIMCAALFALLMIMHMLSSYRTNLLDLYKGDNTHIPHRSVKSNASLLVGSMRYAGYQVGYIAWGYFIMFLVLLLVSCVIAGIIILIKLGIYQWIFNILLGAWPVVVMALVMNILQLVVAKFAFLQERGEFLAIDNRRVLFTFTFFMFFYNIFLGMVSCLLRILKSMAIGTLFLSRLDNSALPRRFQLFDPGFAAYVGFIHVECAHTHPVLIVFLRLLLIRQKYKALQKEKDTNAMEKGHKYKGLGPRLSTRARTRWFLLFTLYHNPGLRIHRKAYIQYMAEMKERLFRHYNMNKSALGKLVKGVNKNVGPITTADGSQAGIEMGPPGNNPMMNWTALLGANKFLMALQKDIMKNDVGMSSGTESKNIASLGDLFGPMQATLETKENNSEMNASSTTNKPKSLWGRARFAASRPAENGNLNKGFTGETYL